MPFCQMRKRALKPYFPHYTFSTFKASKIVVFFEQLSNIFPNLKPRPQSFNRSSIHVASFQTWAKKIASNKIQREMFIAVNISRFFIKWRTQQRWVISWKVWLACYICHYLVINCIFLSNFDIILPIIVSFFISQIIQSGFFEISKIISKKVFSCVVFWRKYTLVNFKILRVI